MADRTRAGKQGGCRECKRRHQRSGRPQQKLGGRFLIFARVVQAVTELAERGSDERKLLESIQTHLRTHGGAIVPRSMRFDYGDAS